METETFLWSKHVIIQVILNFKLILAILQHQRALVCMTNEPSKTQNPHRCSRLSRVAYSCFSQGSFFAHFMMSMYTTVS
jgi:hypothetical protein